MKLNGDHCQCPTCGELFNSTRAFDMHRRGRFTLDPASRRCLTVEQMLARGMAKSNSNWWITSPKGVSGVYA